MILKLVQMYISRALKGPDFSFGHMTSAFYGGLHGTAHYIPGRALQCMHNIQHAVTFSENGTLCEELVRRVMVSDSS